MLSPLPAVRGNWQAPAVLSVSVRSYGDAENDSCKFFHPALQSGKRHPTPPRLNASTSAAAKILCNARDEVVVLDDLFPHADSDLRKQQEKTFLEVLRYVGDGTVPARSRGSIEMKQPDLQLLKQYQERPLMLSTFYQFFIQWILENYDDVVEFLRDHYNFYSAEVTSGVHTRLKEMLFFLHSAHQVFLAYCLAKSYLLADDIVEADRYFCNLLTQIIDQQDQLVRQNACGKLKSETNYTMHFRQLCQNRAFHIADCLEDFNESKHDGLLYKGKLCLRGKCLKRLYPNGSLQAAINQWRRDGILEAGGQNPTKQIFSLGGKRFFFFLLEHLE